MEAFGCFTYFSPGSDVRIVFSQRFHRLPSCSAAWRQVSLADSCLERADCKLDKILEGVDI